MEQYIPLAAVVAEIERLFEKAGNSLGEYRNGAEHTLISINDFLDTIEVKEVDLEKELDSMITPELKFHKALPSLFDVAKHFFELGLKSKSSYVSTPNIDDTLKEMGVDPDAKSAKSFKEFYYMALEKFKAQKGEEV